jgi:hypothetical protein
MAIELRLRQSETSYESAVSEGRAMAAGSKLGALQYNLNAILSSGGV